MPCFDYGAMEQALEHFIKPGCPVEIRILKKPFPLARIFPCSPDAAALEKWITGTGANETNCQIYFTLQELKPGTEERRVQGRGGRQRTKYTTADCVAAYRWLFVDCDPERPAGTASTEEELQAAEDTAARVMAFLGGLGFVNPTKAMSGNGYHVFFPIDLPNTPENVTLIRDCLRALDSKLSTDAVHIDTKVSDPARICKLYGSIATKGNNTPDRPYRRADIIKAESGSARNGRELLEVLAGMGAAAPAPAGDAGADARQDEEAGQEIPLPLLPSNFEISWDLKAVLDAKGIPYKEGEPEEGDKYKLYVSCPNIGQHTSGNNPKDSYLWQDRHGAKHFLCSHEHCKGYRFNNYFNDVIGKIPKGLLSVTVSGRPATDAELNDFESVYHKLPKFEPNIYGNARRMAALYGQDIRWNMDRKTWLLYDGERGTWQAVQPEALYNLYHKALDLSLSAALETVSEPKEVEAIRRFYLRSGNETKKAIEELKGLDGIRAEEAAFDAGMFLINTPAGLWDLENNRPLGKSRDYMLTKCTRGGWREPAPEDMALWLKTLDEIVPDAELQDYIQRLAGVGLTGADYDNEFYIIYGDGGNGKGIVFDTIAYMLGDYGGQVSAEVFCSSRNDGGAEKPRPELLAMKGKRMIFAQETDRGRAFAIGRLKNMTGGGQIVARNPYGLNIAFKITARITIQTNYLPSIYDVYDKGLKRRLRIIPFEQSFIETGDTTLRQRLQTPGVADAVFAWAIEGFRRWYRDKCMQHNLKELPEKMRAILDKYYREQDNTGAFIEEYCTRSRALRVRRSDLYNAFIAANPDVKYIKGMRQRFFMDVDCMGFKQKVERGYTYIIGLGLNDLGPFADADFGADADALL